VTLIAWLARGRRDRPQPVAEIPGDTSRRPLTRPLVGFAVIRAAAIAGAAAIAFGASLSHGAWMPIAAIAAAVLILLDLPQPSNYGAEGDRVLWTLCGVGIAVLVMLLAGLLAKGTARTPPQPATQPA
jgi:O-antigen ligase